MAEVTGQQELNNLIKIAEMQNKTIETLASIVLQSFRIALNSGNALEKEMAKQIQDGKVMTVEVDNRVDALALQKDLRDAGAKHSIAVTVDGRNFVLIHDDEMDIANATVNQFYSQRSRGGITDIKQFARYADQEANVVENVSESTAMMIAYRCEQQHIPLVSKGPKEHGKYDVIFAERDSDKFSDVLNNVAIDMSGEHGKLVDRQMQWENKYRVNALNAIINGENSDGSQLENGAALVDRSGKSIEVNKNAIKICDNGTEKMVARSRKRQVERDVKGAFCTMDRPVLLTKVEYKQYKSLEQQERADFLLDIERKCGRPVLSKAEMEIVANTEAKRTSIQQKLSQDFYRASVEIPNPYNTEQSFWGFKEDEMRNYQDILDKAESKYADEESLEEINDLRDDLQPFAVEIPLSAMMIESEVLEGYVIGSEDVPDVDIHIPDRDTEMSM